ncbi:MAG: YdaU family protein, partial [Burkholderiales bacterium]|nr:YdaU family protein [Burkholderiales bacterium]
MAQGDAGRTALNFFKLYIGDYLRDTGELTLAEHGAYTMMLLHLYATEKPLPMGKELYRLLRAEKASERAAIESVSERFFVQIDGKLTNQRAAHELARAAEISVKNQQIALSREAVKRARSVHEPYTKRARSVAPKQHLQTPDTREEKSSSPSLRSGEESLRLPEGNLTDVPPADSIPPCPQKELIALYHAKLPMLPKVRVWNEANAAALRARWRWVLTSKRADGTPRATDEAQGLAWFGEYFDRVAASDFLTQRMRGCDLAWLVKA